ncbi:MAG: hypothetical protein LBO03_08685 [Acidaminococcales bacterium]|jgi:filamentous hemagglutinin|nr:hypothetical protein [Acidaminococcales bacterium]
MNIGKLEGGEINPRAENGAQDVKLPEQAGGYKDLNNLPDEAEVPLRQGSSYKGLESDDPSAQGKDRHHVPAKSAYRDSGLDSDDGPCIRMERIDHRQTASYGVSDEAKEYRAAQSQLIAQGKFREAQQMDIDDIRMKFGKKYDGAIAEMLEYTDQLEQEGRI